MAGNGDKAQAVNRHPLAALAAQALAQVMADLGAENFLCLSFEVEQGRHIDVTVQVRGAKPAPPAAQWPSLAQVEG